MTNRPSASWLGLVFRSIFCLLLAVHSSESLSNLPARQKCYATTRTYYMSAAVDICAPPDENGIIEAADRFMTSGTGYFSPQNNSTFLADDFVFRGPVIGPLGREDYGNVLEYFKVYEALPDVKPNCFGYAVDPADPWRVWFFVRATGTYQKPLDGALGKAAAAASGPPDGRAYRGSTETWSLTFNDALQVRQITAGYVADLYEDDATTNGRGLTFGILSTLGLSLPTAPGDPRLRLIQLFSSFFDGTGLTPKAWSGEDKIPSWKMAYETNDSRFFRCILHAAKAKVSSFL